MSERNRFLVDDVSWARLRDALFTIVALAAIVTMALTSYFTLRTNRTVSDFNNRQVQIVQRQNDAQLCAQHDIVEAVRRLGIGFSRSLGLPLTAYKDISPPDVTGIDCEQLIHQGVTP